MAAMLVVAPAALAEEHHDRCEQRIHNAEAKLHRAIRKHGEDSKQARRRREDLERARHECGMDRDHDRH
jgi:hypothetical protein